MSTKVFDIKDKHFYEMLRTIETNKQNETYFYKFDKPFVGGICWWDETRNNR